MRDYLLFYLNGKPHRVKGQNAFLPLSTYLRSHQGATGTKVVCEEGDCGACSVIVGKIENQNFSYKPLNSCIQFLYQLDCTHVITIEGLKVDGQLNPVQQAMVQCHGAQCGYCTPGFVVSLCAMFENKAPQCEQEVKDGLTGNLCRCTGYEPIIKAALAVDATEVLKLHTLYPSSEMLEAFSRESQEAVLIKTKEHTLFNPVQLDEAVRFKANNPGTVIVAGGTDVGVYWNKRSIKPQNLMSISHLPGLSEITISDGILTVGAKTTLSDLEEFTAQNLPELYKILWLFGAPQIRNAATLAGNIANGSPIADSLPFLYVMGAMVELSGTNGRRTVEISKFFQGYKKLDLTQDEIITHILIPLPTVNEVLKLYKVSKRRNLDISAFTAAFRLSMAGTTIKEIDIAYGGVAATVLRLPKTEAFLKGKTMSLDTMSHAGAIASSEITPISDVRGSSDFRYTLAQNILLKLYFELLQQEDVACQL